MAMFSRIETFDPAMETGSQHIEKIFSLQRYLWMPVKYSDSNAKFLKVRVNPLHPANF